MSNLPTPIYLAITTAATEQRKVAQLSATLPGHKDTLAQVERDYQQAKAAAEEVLSEKAAAVQQARDGHDGVVRELNEAAKNVKIGQDMVRLWCEANSCSVPEMPPLTMPFQAVPPAPPQSGLPAQPVGEAQAVSPPQGVTVTVADIRDGAVYGDTYGHAWRRAGEINGAPVLASDDGRTVPAERAIRDFGPLHEYPAPAQDQADVTRPNETPDGGDRA